MPFKPTHGMTDTPEFKAWLSMRDRCNRETHEFFGHYGGRGVTICARWDVFENFLTDVGPRPSPAYSIDRYPNNDGNYEPGNVRWATRRDQTLNRRCTLMVEIEGNKIPVVEACRLLGLNHNTVSRRIYRGWTPEAALKPPAWKRPDLTARAMSRRNRKDQTK